MEILLHIYLNNYRSTIHHFLIYNILLALKLRKSLLFENKNRTHFQYFRLGMVKKKKQYYYFNLYQFKVPL